MISDGEAQILSSALAEIPLGESISDIEFTEQELNELQSLDGDKSGGDVNPKRFFVATGYQICRDCGEITDQCSCVECSESAVYHLDPKYIVEEWCEDIENLDHYEDLYIEQNGPPLWAIKAVSREFGVITYYVVSQSDRLVDVSPDLYQREFVVSLVEAKEVAEQPHYYMWYNLRTEAHHKELHTAIRGTLSPLSEGVCDLTSGIAVDSRNAISNNIRKYLSEKGFESVDPQRNIGQIGRTIDFAEIEFAGQDESGGTVLICSCENSANDIHLHYVKNGEIQPVEDCKVAKSAAQSMRKKIDWRETLDQRTRNITGRTKALALAAATVSLGPIAAALAGLGGLEVVNLDKYPYIPELVLSIILILLFIALIWPSVQISLFSWDIRGLLSRSRDLVPIL
jgi:hypothetical protein